MRAALWALASSLTVALGACDDTTAPIGSPRPPAIGIGGSTGSSSTATTTAPTTQQGVFGCACIAATASQGCANCYNGVTAAGNACSAKSLQCQSSEACRAGFVCLNQCDFAPACVAECLTVAKAGQGLPLLEALFTCTCGACGDACSGVATAECDGGVGGAGGGGGTDGGAGGGAAGAGGAGP